MNIKIIIGIIVWLILMIFLGIIKHKDLNKPGNELLKTLVESKAYENDKF